VDQQLSKSNVKRQVAKKPKDEKDMQVEKLKNINLKLRSKLKDLNVLLEKTLEKANSRKIYKLNQQSQK